jgi:hypothetical protein
MNMLGLAKRTKARFLLTSTSEVYGDPLVHPQARDDPAKTILLPSGLKRPVRPARTVCQSLTKSLVYAPWAIFCLTSCEAEDVERIFRAGSILRLLACRKAALLLSQRITVLSS